MSKSNFDGEYTDEQLKLALEEVKVLAMNDQWEKLEKMLKRTRIISIEFEKELLNSLTIQQYTLYKHYLKDE